jgi:hypothetical protein
MRPTTVIIGLLVVQSLGCAAVRSTYHLAQAEQAVAIATDAEASDLAAYEWTLTVEYIEKAREEWGNAAFGDAEELSKRAREWAARAEQVALRVQRYQDVENVQDIVPEEIELNEEPEDALFLSPEEKLELLDEWGDE